MHFSKKQFLAYWRDGEGEIGKNGVAVMFMQRGTCRRLNEDLATLSSRFFSEKRSSSPLSDIDVELEEICSRQVERSNKVHGTLP